MGWRTRKLYGRSARALLLYDSPDDDEPRARFTLDEVAGVRSGDVSREHSHRGDGGSSDGDGSRAFSFEVRPSPWTYSEYARPPQLRRPSLRQRVLRAFGVGRGAAANASLRLRPGATTIAEGRDTATGDCALDLRTTAFEAESAAACREWVQVIRDRTYWYSGS